MQPDGLVRDGLARDGLARDVIKELDGLYVRTCRFNFDHHKMTPFSRVDVN
jgi:hypothetical protein